MHRYDFTARRLQRFRISMTVAGALFACCPLVAQSLPFGGHEAAVSLESDPFLGDWEGEWSEPRVKMQKQNPGLVAQVIPRGNDQYQIRFLPEFDQRCVPYAVVLAVVEKGQLVFHEELWKGVITSTTFAGEGVLKDSAGQFQLNKVTRNSPTLGRKPPKRAVVLFQGSDFDAWHATGSSKEQIHWRLVEGAMRINADRQLRHGLETNQRFEDLRLHLEFRLPLEPENTGQARGNSGVFIGPYEIQVLDSYGLEGYYNECGALYKLAAPITNMCAPPLQWQTFDITFRTAQFNAEDQLVKHPRMTVRHNGKVIHRNQPLTHQTSNTQIARDKPVETGPLAISLQNHGHAVEFRNIWVVNLSKESADETRPESPIAPNES